MKEEPVTAVKQEKEVEETKPFGVIGPLRPPKHLQENARADMMFTAAAQASVNAADALWDTAAQTPESSSTYPHTKPNGDSKEGSPSKTTHVHFQEPEEEEEDEDDEDEEEYYDEENKFGGDQDNYHEVRNIVCLFFVNKFTQVNKFT